MTQPPGTQIHVDSQLVKSQLANLIHQNVTQYRWYLHSASSNVQNTNKTKSKNSLTKISQHFINIVLPILFFHPLDETDKRGEQTMQFSYLFRLSMCLIQCVLTRQQTNFIKQQLKSSQQLPWISRQIFSVSTCSGNIDVSVWNYSWRAADMQWTCVCW